MKFSKTSELMAVICGVLLGLPLPSQSAEDLVLGFEPSGAARVHVYNDERRVATGTGTLIGEAGTVFVPLSLVSGRDRVTVVSPATGAEIIASSVADNEELEIALVRAPGLGLEPLSVASAPIKPGQVVVSAGYWELNSEDLQASRGIVGRADIDSPVGKSYLSHNAMILAAGFGGPLLNECGELVAVNLPAPNAQRWWERTARDPESEVFAISVHDALAWLEETGVLVELSDETCLSAVEKAKTEAEAAAVARDEAKQAQKQAEETARQAREAAEKARIAEERADAMKEDAERATKDTEAAQRRLEAAKEAAKAARAEATALENVARQSANLATTAEERVAALEEQLRRDAERGERQLLLTVGVAAIVLLTLLGIWYRRSRKARDVLELERQRAQQAHIEAEAARKMAEEPLPRISDGLLTGTGSNGGRIAQRISGTELAQNPEGLVLGRHPGVAQVIIDDEDVSRRHLLIRSVPGGLTVEDLESTNGTTVNGQPVQPGSSHVVSPGDEIGLGQVRLRLSMS